MEFTTALHHHLAAIHARDLDGYMRTVHKEATVILPNGKVITGFDEIHAFHRDWFGDPDWSMETETVRSLVVGDSAIAVLKVDYQDLDQEGRPYRLNHLLSLIFARTGEEWLLVHDQNTTC